MGYPIFLFAISVNSKTVGCVMWEEGTEGMKLKQYYIIMLSDNIYIILFSKGGDTESACN